MASDTSSHELLRIPENPQTSRALPDPDILQLALPQPAPPQLAPPQPAHTPLQQSGSILYAFKSWKKVLEWPWLWESLACALSIAAMCSILAVLASYNGREMPVDLPYSMNLPSIVSALTTFIKAAITVPLASGLSQIMWCRSFRTDIPLSDLSFFDSASRSIVTGGSVLLWKRRGGILSSLAFLIGLGTLALGPLTQGALRSREINGNATLPRCLSTEFPGINSAGEVFNQFHAAVYSNEYNMANPVQDQALQRLNTDCGTGNCTWPLYSSLAICINVTNVTSDVEAHCNDDYTFCEYLLPNRLSLQLGQGIGNSLDSININGSTSLPTSNYEFLGDYPITKFSIINYKQRLNYSAYEGVIYWCVEAYNTTVYKNVLEQNVISWYDQSAKPPGKNGLVLEPPGDYWAGLGLGNSTGFRVDEGFQSAFLSHAFDLPTDDNHVLRQISFNGIWDLDEFFTFLARSMTNRLRYSVCPDVVNGTQNRVKTVIRVKYAWTILPCVTVIATTGFFLSVLFWHCPPGILWKSSILATLFHGISLELRETHSTESLVEIGEMEAEAAKIRVRLEEICQDIPEERDIRKLGLEKAKDAFTP